MSCTTFFVPLIYLPFYLRLCKWPLLCFLCTTHVLYVALACLHSKMLDTCVSVCMRGFRYACKQNRKPTNAKSESVNTSYSARGRGESLWYRTWGFFTHHVTVNGYSASEEVLKRLGGLQTNQWCFTVKRKEKGQRVQIKRLKYS